ncbi:hypothetical protein BT69DRAFT_1219350 [Atractiella rhizophila]|nr:hypothetical protein BT69DRAFT_1219350 [Atractiella rhizophila]
MLRSLVAPSGPKITAQDRAILSLKVQRDKLKQYQKQIEAVLNREQEIAKIALKEGKKDKALTALRRRKYQESLLSKTDTQLETLQNLVSSIEFALIEKDVMFGLQQGNDVLKELNKELSIEKVEKLMDDTAEAIAYQREVDELLSSKITADEEDEIQRELAALEAEEVRSVILSFVRTDRWD